MIAFAFRFPGGRYHATPWGRHANEADSAWPPEPVRILRALVATWWRKADRARFPKSVLDDLIDKLAADLPVFHLPPAIHSHVRAFMPVQEGSKVPVGKKMIYDAFLRFDPNAELTVVWPNVVLGSEQKDLCSYLLERIGYFGRAESWVSAHVADGWDGEYNCCPRKPEHVSNGDVPVDIAVPLTAAEWAELRSRLLSGTKAKTKAKLAMMQATLPERLCDALSVDTSEWQDAGWSSPPPLRKEVYDRPPVGPVPLFSVPMRSVSGKQPGRPEVARFVLAGRPQPRIEETLRIGELARAALMSGGGNPPPEFSGRDSNGPQRNDPSHAHAFFVPEDADADGFIDHLVVFCRNGFSTEARLRLDRLHKLWLAHGRTDEYEERGRTEWRLALEDIATPQEFGRASALLRLSHFWKSVTPYLMPWHAKPGFGVTQQIERELLRRGGSRYLANVAVLDDPAKRALKFERIRSRRGLVQPDRVGCFVRLTFHEPVTGPVTLGFACHYGLGLFSSADETARDL